MPAVLIDRESELAELRAALATRPGLIVMRGRRRVGTSYLLSIAFGKERMRHAARDDVALVTADDLFKS